MSGAVTLDAGILTSLSDTAGYIGSSVLNIAPQIIIYGLAVWGVVFIVNKIPGWFRRLIK